MKREFGKVEILVYILGPREREYTHKHNIRVYEAEDISRELFIEHKRHAPSWKPAFDEPDFFTYFKERSAKTRIPDIKSIDNIPDRLFAFPVKPRNKAERKEVGVRRSTSSSSDSTPSSAKR